MDTDQEKSHQNNVNVVQDYIKDSRIEEIKELIKNGQYKIDDKELAKVLLKRVFQINKDSKH